MWGGRKRAKNGNNMLTTYFKVTSPGKKNPGFLMRAFPVSNFPFFNTCARQWPWIGTGEKREEEPLEANQRQICLSTNCYYWNVLLLYLSLMNWSIVTVWAILLAVIKIFIRLDLIDNFSVPSLDWIMQFSLSIFFFFAQNFRIELSNSATFALFEERERNIFWCKLTNVPWFSAKFVWICLHFFNNWRLISVCLSYYKP